MNTENIGKLNPSINFDVEMSEEPDSIKKLPNPIPCRRPSESFLKGKGYTSLELDAASEKPSDELHLIDPEKKTNYMNYKKLHKMRKVNATLSMSNVKLS